MRVKGKLLILILFAILILGSLLRIYHLGSVPAGLHFDEAQSGYNGFLLWKHNRNLLGDYLPIHIDYFGDYRPAGTSYLTAPIVGLLGMSVFTTRLPFVLFGTVLILLTYYLSFLCFKNQKIAILTAFLMAISQYSVIFSRGSAEGIIELVFSLTALSALVLFLKLRKVRFLVLAYLCFVASYFSYQSSRIIIPLLGPITVFLGFLEFRPPKKFLLLGIFPIILYLIFPFLFFFKSPFGQGRFQQVGLFFHPTVQMEINEGSREDGSSGSILVSRLAHNKIIGYSEAILENYVTYFSPEPLLFSVSHPDYYSVPKIGPVTLVEFLGLILGLSICLVKKCRPLVFLPFAILFAAPLAASLTFDTTPNFLRSLFLIPGIVMVSSFGLVMFSRRLGKLRKTLFFAVIVGIGIFQFLRFGHQYFVHQPKHLDAIKSRRTEMQDLAYFLNAHKNESIWLSDTDGPYIYYLFFNHIDIFQSKVYKPGRYYSGTFSINNLSFSKSTCLGLDDLLAASYDIVIYLRGCSVPVWSEKMMEFHSSDGSLALIAYKLNKKTYSSFVQEYNSAKSDTERTNIKEVMNKGFFKVN